MSKVVGPGAVVNDEVAPSPALEGAHEYEYVTILNPLKDDFQVMVAQDVPVNVPFQVRDKTAMVQSERDITMQYGLNLKNPDHIGKKYIHNTTVIPAGRTMNFRGNEAQVVVRQLVNEIMQREGKKRFLADAVARRKVEDSIIKGRGNIQDLMDERMATPRTQMEDAINKSNEVNNEVAFPGLEATGTEEAAGGGNTPSETVKPVTERANSQPAKATKG